VAVLKVQREIGGNLADKLNLIGHVIRQRKKI
jgi:Flp pilus assembly protein TadB